MLHGEEKIWFLVNTLDKERRVTPKSKPVALHPMNDLNNHYSKPDFIELFETLEQDSVAKLLNQFPTDQTYGKYQIELLPGFDGYIEKLEENPEYLEWSGKKPKPKNYFSPERRVDFSKPKEENKDKYISVGQIEELMKLPKEERAKVEKNSLTQEHLDDITEFQDGLKEASKVFNQRANEALKNLIPKINFQDVMKTNTVAIAPPVSYQAQSVGLLKQLVEQQKKEDASSKDKAVLTITYTNSRQVVLNGVFQLSKPTLNGVNDLVFSYLYENPGKSFSKQQLETVIGQKISKTLHKIVENLGFKSDLARAFFSVSKNDISFRNPITRDELNDMGLGNIKFN
jgi:hypothetical protein